jgi:aminoglycoside phosphotransferase (APT) family kinase protein
MCGRSPRGGRRPLNDLDAVTRKAIEAGLGVIDSVAAIHAWTRALEAPAWNGKSTWIHTDLLRSICSSAMAGSAR